MILRLREGRRSRRSTDGQAFAGAAVRAAARGVAERLEGRVLLSSTLIAVTDHRDLIFDPTRNQLDITTSSGKVQRYDVASHALLAPLNVGSSLNGGDITRDGTALYVADGGADAIRKVSLADGTVTTINYTPAFGEGFAWDVKVANNGKALVSTEFNGSGWTPLRQIDLATDTLTTRTDLSSVRQNSPLARGADGSLLFLQESNISNGPIHSYDAATDHFFATGNTNTFVGGPAAVNRDGTLIAMMLNGVSVMDRNLNTVKVLPGVSGGAAFDPQRNVMYAVDVNADQVVAYDTDTWQEAYRVSVGENVSSAGIFGPGMMAVSSDSKELFLATPTGVRMIDLPQPNGIPAIVAVGGFPAVTGTGLTGSFTVRIKDQAGQLVSGYRGTVHFTSTDPQAVLPADYTFTATDAGVHTFSATLKTAGTQSITVTDTANALLTGSQSGITVNATPVSLLPLANRRDMVWDPLRHLLYITTGSGTVERYDPATQTLLPSYQVSGGQLNGEDITPDDQYLYVADGVAGPTTGFFHKINLNTGAVSDIPYALAFGEGSAFDIAIANNGKALLDTNFQGSGWVPLRQLDLATDTLTTRSDYPQVRQSSPLQRGADRSTIFLEESNISSGPIAVYDAATDSFPQKQNANTFVGGPSAVSRDGNLIAMQLGGISVMDKMLHLVHNFTGLVNAAFDPVRDVMYGLDGAHSQIVAYDARTWAENYRLNIGETVSSASTFGTGTMTVSDDGKELFLETPSGIRWFAIPQPTGVAASLAISGASTFVSVGAPDSFTVTAKDPSGAVATGYRGTVHFTSSDPNATLPADYTFTADDAGTHTFTVSFATPGTQSVTATDTVNSSLNATANGITVPSGAVRLIPVTDHNSLVFDPTRDRLYILEAAGRIDRFDIATQSLLSPIQVGGSLVGGDITPDGSTLYITDGSAGATQGVIHKVNLATGAVTNLPYNLSFAEGGGSTLAIAGNGKAFFTTHFNGSGWTPLRQIDTSTDTITTRTDAPGSGGGGQLTEGAVLRGEDRSLLFFKELNISSGPIFTYSSATDTFPKSLGTNSFPADQSAVSRDGSLIALEIYSRGVQILDSNLNTVHTLPEEHGGLVFDPTRNILYEADDATDQIIAYDTTTWQARASLPIGENIPSRGSYLSASDDGKWLFLATLAGVRVYSTGPLADPGGPYVVAEGGSVTLNGGNSYSLLGGAITTYEWDTNYNGTTFHTTATGATVNFSGVGLDGPGSRKIALRVTDSVGNTSIQTATLTIVNVPPTLIARGPSAVFLGIPYTLTLGSSDPGPDTISKWTINWGDGNVQTVSGNPGSVTHTYAATGSYVIATSATDEDGTYNGPNVAVTAAGGAPTLAANGALTVVGTANADSISLVSSSGTLTVQVDGASMPFSASAVTSVNLQALGGNDNVTLSGIAVSSTVDLGDGNDVLLVTSGSPTASVNVSGGTGDDTVSVGVGATSSVTFDGGAGNNTLVFNASQGDDTITLSPASVNGGGSSASWSNVQAVSVLGGAGADTINITLAHAPAPAVTVDAGDGNDVFNYISGPASGTLVARGNTGNDLLTVSGGAGAAVSYDGGAGSDRIEFNASDGNDTINISSTAISDGATATTFSNTENVLVNGNGGDDVFQVAGTLNLPQGGGGTTLLGGQGNDTFNLGGSPAAAPTLSSIGGPLSIDGQAGTDALNLRDDGYTLSTAVYSIGQGTFSRGGTGAVTFAVESVQLTSGAAGATFNVSPNAAASVSVTDKAGGGVLNVNPQAVTGIHQTGAGDSGTFLFTNRMPVTYAGMSRIADVIAPTVTDAFFNAGGSANTLTFWLTENVAQSLALSDVQVTANSGGAVVPIQSVTFDWNSNAVIVTLASPLPAGLYTATLSSAGLTDAAGNHLDGNADGTGGDDYVFNFSTLVGDINHNGAVGFDDLLTLAQHYGTYNTSANGDLTGDHQVGFNDLLLLAQHYGQSLPVAAAAAPTSLADLLATSRVRSRRLLRR